MALQFVNWPQELIDEYNYCMFGYTLEFKEEVKEMATDRREYHNEYLKGLKEIRFRVKSEEFEEMQAAAKEQGYASMRQFFLAAIREKMGKEDA